MEVSVPQSCALGGLELTTVSVNFYISQPASSSPVPNTAVLYLTDVFGINLTENRL